MKIVLKYFTGTGNSLKILSVCKEIFTENQHTVSISAITPGEKLPEADLLGFCFPVYAFALPRIVRKYLKGIKRYNTKQKTFVIINAGDADESGFSATQAIKILKKKNCNIIYSAVIQMPINWTTSSLPPFPPSKNEADIIIQKGVIETRKVAQHILNGITRYHAFNYPERFSKAGFYWQYLAFRYMGIQNLWRNFRVYAVCDGCGKCARICPTKSIKMTDKKPVWSSTCEQCMRCVNFCPKEAIYQTMGGDTKGKHKYTEPDFNPLKEINRI